MTKRLLILVAASVFAGCSLNKQDAPDLAGPSTYGLSIDLAASPDHLTQNGSSQSVITIVARDAANQPVRSLPLHADLFVGNTNADFGTLSSRNISTGNDGRATIAYLAPPPDPPAFETDHVVTILVTPVGTDFGSQAAKTVSIRLMRPGVILPPNGTPVPAFFFSPISPREEETVLFDASTSSDDGQIVSYQWTFGDGATGSGIRPTHSYAVAGTYSVILTVRDDRGLSASTSPTQISVTGAANPQADFTISPTDPAVNDVVRVNASASTVPPGRTIVSYQWDFGDSAVASGVVAEHRYNTARTYTIVLTVTDSTGRKGTVSKQIQVK